MSHEQDNSLSMPQNIWGAKQQESYFRKTFFLGEETERAILRIFVDTGYDLYLNSRFVAAVDEWGNTRDYDIVALLLPGRNIISVKGVNHGGHRGLSMELRVILRNGNVVSVVSDSTWHSSPEERWGWKSPEYDDSGWGRARLLPLEQVGAEQWKSRPGDDPTKIIPHLACSPFLLGSVPKIVDSPFFTAKIRDFKTPPTVFDIIGKEYQANLDSFPPKIMFPVKIVVEDHGNGAIENAAGILQKGGSCARISATRPSDGPCLIIDFGGETVGYLRVRTASECNVYFKLVFAETLGECHYLPPKESLFRKMVTEEVCLSSGEQEWESNNRQGFRFVKIEFIDCQSPVEISGVSVMTSLYPVSY
ncbi:MAG: family 78 glycoside hydrolase catalytic domain, partial [Lentisphaerae bacterium]|nr:family 78 glycoside hydrolase catalytic domain [Lentisphaerota bacterium]